MTRAGLALVLLLAARGAQAGQLVCPGDCNADGATRLNEIEDALQLIFAAESLGACAAADVDGSGTIAAADILAVLQARAELPQGCSAPLPLARWTTLAPLAVSGRQEVGAAALGGAIYVVGGFDDRGGGSAVVERYDVGEDRWTSVADLPRPLQHIGTAAVGGFVYSVGGFVGSSFAPTADVHRYDPCVDEWNAVAPLPEARGALATAVLDGRLHALGGSAFTGSVTTHTAYDPATNEWTALAPFPGNGRNHLAAAVLAGEICVVGGRPGVGQSNSAALDCWDPAANEWQSRAPMPTARSGHAVAVVDGRLVALGGEVSAVDPHGVFPHVEVYDPRTDGWERLDDMPVPRHGISAVAIGRRIFIPGGATVAGFGATAHHDALDLEF